ncbi:MAG TPA: hypothetical protein VJ809_05800, partial [Pirellulales bacterium]|nr:hypothetical protein [Pirellulales bacterium]
MRQSPARQSPLRTTGFEPLEPRSMMSSSPPADFVLDYFTDIGAGAIGPVSPHATAPQTSLAPLSLADAHTQTGLAAARAAYGLTGRG